MDERGPTNNESKQRKSTYFGSGGPSGKTFMLNLQKLLKRCNIIYKDARMYCNRELHHFLLRGFHQEINDFNTKKHSR